MAELEVKLDRKLFSGELDIHAVLRVLTQADEMAAKLIEGISIPRENIVALSKYQVPERAGEVVEEYMKTLVTGVRHANPSDVGELVADYGKAMDASDSDFEAALSAKKPTEDIGTTEDTVEILDLTGSGKPALDDNSPMVNRLLEVYPDYTNAQMLHAFVHVAPKLFLAKLTDETISDLRPAIVDLRTFMLFEQPNLERHIGHLPEQEQVAVSALQGELTEIYRLYVEWITGPVARTLESFAISKFSKKAQQIRQLFTQETSSRLAPSVFSMSLSEFTEALNEDATSAKRNLRQGINAWEELNSSRIGLQQEFKTEIDRLIHLAAREIGKNAEESQKTGFRIPLSLDPDLLQGVSVAQALTQLTELTRVRLAIRCCVAAMQGQGLEADQISMITRGMASMDRLHLKTDQIDRLEPEVSDYLLEQGVFVQKGTRVKQRFFDTASPKERPQDVADRIVADNLMREITAGTITDSGVLPQDFSLIRGALLTVMSPIMLDLTSKLTKVRLPRELKKKKPKDPYWATDLAARRGVPFDLTGPSRHT